MKVSFNIKENDSDGLDYIWKVGRAVYVISSDWTYKKPGEDKINILENLKSLQQDNTRSNKKMNLFRHNNTYYVYSDGNSDPETVITHFIIEYLSIITYRDLDKQFNIRHQKTKIVNYNKPLLPNNILVGNKLLSDILIEIFEIYGGLIEDQFILNYCFDNTELDEIFDDEKDENVIDTILKMYNNLSQDEKQELILKMIF